MLLTSLGWGIAVIQSVGDYETAKEEQAFMRAVARGQADLEMGREFSLDAARERLGLNQPECFTQSLRKETSIRFLMLITGVLVKGKV
jgi:hypothetical protein